MKKILIFTSFVFSFCKTYSVDHSSEFRKKPDYYVYAMDIQKRDDVHLSKENIKDINYRLSPENIKLEDSEYVVKLLYTDGRKELGQPAHTTHRVFYWIPTKFIMDDNENIKNDFFITVMKPKQAGFLTIWDKTKIHFRILKNKSRL